MVFIKLFIYRKTKNAFNFTVFPLENFWRGEYKLSKEWQNIYGRKNFNLTEMVF